MNLLRALARSALAFGLVLSALHPLQAALLTRDLGEGLTYYRAPELPADLPTTDANHKKPGVLDLRYAHGDAAAATVLDGWLKFNATPRTPIFLLLNADTDSTLLTSLAARLPAPGIVVIGSASNSVVPLDITLKVPAATERRAYDALTSGVVIESLLNDTPAKERNDEARLAKDRAGTPDDQRPSDDPLDDPLPGAEKPAKAKTPPPLIDPALQRAVQLHRSLKALKKL